MQDPFHLKYITCENTLGEGVFWSSIHQRVFWFDILNRRLYSANEEAEDLQRFTLPFMASYGAPLDAATLMLVTEEGICRFNLLSGEIISLFAVECENPGTRSNDATLDGEGNLWFSTMGKDSEPGAGALYRLSKSGTLATLLRGLTIPNSLVADLKNNRLYFTDSLTRVIHRYTIDSNLSIREPCPFVDISDGEALPDGACLNPRTDGIFSAQWGGGRVVEYGQDGSKRRTYPLPASQISCCALGGAGKNKLFVTSARVSLSEDQLSKEPLAGSLFILTL